LSFLFLCLAIPASQCDLVYAETVPRTRVYGYVSDFRTHQPLPRAQISCRLRDEEGIIAETNASGFFEAYVDGFRRYTLFAYYDNASTPGVDYVPAYQEAALEDHPYYIEFSLLPGASIDTADDPFFSFEDSVFLCNIIDKDGFLELTRSVKDWWKQRSELNYTTGTVTSLYHFELSQPKYGTMIVPVTTGVKIEVGVYRGFPIDFRDWDIGRTAHFFIPSEGGYLYLRQGERVVISLRNARLNLEASVEMPKRLKTAKSLAEEIGILSSYDRIRISSAEELLRRAQDSISDGDYVKAQADLYESYIILGDVESAIISLFQNSVLSISFITPFIGVTSSSLGAIFFKDKPRRIIISIIFFIFLVMTLYFAYPGYTFVQNRSYNPLAGTLLESWVIPLLLVFSLFLGLILINGPYTHGEKTDRSSLSLRSAIVATFSLAVDNLKRRKIRTFLTMFFMLISVFAFIIATSYSYEAGFIIRQIRTIAPSEGIFVSQQAVNAKVMPFGPVETQIIQWLSRRPEVVLAVPLLENVPQIGAPPPPLGALFNGDLSLNYSVSGVLGIKPSLETNMTKIDEIVDLGRFSGRFLNDVDFNGVLISQEAKEALHVSVNDTVRFCEKDFRVIGIFNSGKLGEVKDLNGDPIVPQQVLVQTTFGGPVYLPSYVVPERVVIMLSETASELPLNIVVSRLNVQTRKSEDMISLARTLVLIFPRVETFVSTNNEIRHLYIGHYQVAQGFAESTVLLVLIALNVSVMMLNVVYERRREVITMSTIGMNPSQITAIFASEAFVMAFIAGSFGYLLGLTSYVFLGLFPSPPILKYKVEAFWSILALCFSISASVLGSIVPASKASIMATPSLLRRFIITSKERSQKEVWTLDIPVKVRERDLGEFFDFMEERFKVFNDPTFCEERVYNIVREKNIYDLSRARLFFTYKYAASRIITENELFPIKDVASDQYFIKLASKSRITYTITGKETSARQTAYFIRRIALEYTERRTM